MEGNEGTLTEEGMKRVEPSCILIMIMMGKILLNLFMFWAKQRPGSPSFLGSFCLSLALLDFALVAAVSAIHYFQDFCIGGIRFTNYHICLFTQIISHVYGILHYPVFLASCLDYYLAIVKSVNLPRVCLGLLYTTAVLFLWIAAFVYVLRSPVPSSALDSSLPSYQYTFYVSSQSYYLSAVILLVIVSVLAVCHKEVATFGKSMKMISYDNNTVILFSFSTGKEWPVRGKREILVTFMVSFLGTWAPLVLLQIIMLVLCAQIPGYIDMNVPWLYFLNSFLVGMAYWLKYPDVQLTKTSPSPDPFVSWKYCVLPLLGIEHTKEAVPLNELSPTVIII
ncbi:putative G-protein coupled receptor 160 [Ascaphus truei]|uniref:putative G-protein coupled receptor 160 n=1 Tax=Ascaphus truei TaxID=8439 RepID=UPI003F59A212